jgi:hypothetical protein
VFWGTNSLPSGDRALRSGAIILWHEIAEPGIAA